MSKHNCEGMEPISRGVDTRALTPKNGQIQVQQIWCLDLQKLGH
jgi:hypothetical protein